MNSVSSLAEALVRKGHSVTVLALNEDDGQPMDVRLHEVVDVEGVSVIYFQRRDSLLEGLRNSMTQACRWEPAFFEWCRAHLAAFDWVHLQIGLLQPARWIAKSCKRRGIALAYHQRGNLDPRRFKRCRWLKSIYIRWFEVPVLDQAKVLFALSGWESEIYRLWSSPARIEQLSNGVHVDFWGAGLEDVSASETGRSVVWSARWDLRKGPLEFIETARILSEQLPEVQFVMLGPERGADLERVEAVASAYGLKNLTIKKGLDARSRREYLQSADFFILPTYGEGFSLGILEALAAGCFVLTTEEANFPELKEQSFARILENDPSAFADAVVEVLTNRSRVDGSVKRAASAFVRREYDWSTLADRYLKIMEEG